MSRYDNTSPCSDSTAIRCVLGLIIMVAVILGTVMIRKGPPSATIPPPERSEIQANMAFTGKFPL